MQWFWGWSVWLLLYFNRCSSCRQRCCIIMKWCTREWVTLCFIPVSLMLATKCWLLFVEKSFQSPFVFETSEFFSCKFHRLMQESWWEAFSRQRWGCGWLLDGLSSSLWRFGTCLQLMSDMILALWWKTMHVWFALGIISCGIVLLYVHIVRSLIRLWCTYRLLEVLDRSAIIRFDGIKMVIMVQWAKIWCIHQVIRHCWLLFSFIICFVSLYRRLGLVLSAIRLLIAHELFRASGESSLCIFGTTIAYVCSSLLSCIRIPRESVQSSLLKLLSLMEHLIVHHFA